MGISVVNVVWQVFTRYVLRNPSSYTEELARYLLIWIGLLGAAYATGRGMHLAIDLVPSHLRGAARRRLEMAIGLLVLAFALGGMVYGGSRLVWITLYLHQTSAALRIPLGCVYLAIPLAGLLMAFYAVDRILGASDPRRAER
ncbi:MAG: TRAP transporter small permease [Planctomycetes bacterium]|nr:TRAP transporter small permease [Planctomycetota bacterium]